MRLTGILSYAAPAALVVLFSSVAPLLAQESMPSHATTAVGRLIEQIDPDELKAVLTITLIFGTGAIAVTLFGLAAVVSAMRGNSPDLDELNGRLDAIEAKLDMLGSKVGIAPGDTLPGASRQV